MRQKKKKSRYCSNFANVISAENSTYNGVYCIALELGHHHLMFCVTSVHSCSVLPVYTHVMCYQCTLMLCVTSVHSCSVLPVYTQVMCFLPAHDSLLESILRYTPSSFPLPPPPSSRHNHPATRGQKSSPIYCTSFVLVCIICTCLLCIYLFQYWYNYVCTAH